MKFTFNSNTLMAVVMVLTMGGSIYGYFQGQIDDVRNAIPLAYDESRIVERVTTLESKDITEAFAVLKQQISDLPVQKDWSESINAINVTLATIQTKLESFETHDHNGTYVRQENK